MGGGGVMRAAAKVAGIGTVNSGIRGGVIGASVQAEQLVRKPSRQISTGLSSSSAGVAADVAPVEPLYFDDWELAGAENDPFLDSGEPLPRVVFGGAPSLEEAEEATNDLKVALEKVYLTPSTYTESSGSIGSDLISKSTGYVDTICETKVAGVPQVAMQAFTLLNESPAVQSVVASIARDPKVWDAFMQNESLVEFLQNQKTNGESLAPKLNKNVVVEEVLDQVSPVKCTEASEESQPCNFETVMMDVFENIRANVVNMVSNVASFLQNIFGVPSGDKNAENIGLTVTEKTLAASFMGLAVMVVMVVALKRV